MMNKNNGGMLTRASRVKSTKLETASEQGGGGFGPSLNPYSEILKKLGEKIEI